LNLFKNRRRTDAFNKSTRKNNREMSLYSSRKEIQTENIASRVVLLQAISLKIGGRAALQGLTTTDMCNRIKAMNTYDVADAHIIEYDEDAKMKEYNDILAVHGIAESDGWGKMVEKRRALLARCLKTNEKRSVLRKKSMHLNG